MRTSFLLISAVLVFPHLCRADSDADYSEATSIDDSEFDSQQDVFDDDLLGAISSKSVSLAVEQQVRNKLNDDADIHRDHDNSIRHLDHTTLTNDVHPAISPAYSAHYSPGSSEPVPEPVGLSLLGMAMVFILMAYSIFRKQQEAAFAAASETNPT